MVALGRTVGQAVTEKQLDFLRAATSVKGRGVFQRPKFKINSYVGGRGSGKTIVGARAVQRCAKDGQPWLCLGPSSPMIKQSSFPTFIEECKNLGTFIDAVKGSEMRVIFRTFDGGKATLFFKSGHNPETIRGGSYAGLWNDEASFTNEMAFQNAVLSLRYKRKQGPIFLTFTPRGRIHWTFRLHFREIEEHDVWRYKPAHIHRFVDTPYIRARLTKIIQSTSMDNPFLASDFIQTARKTLTAALFRQEIGGAFEDVSGLMFDRHNFQRIDESEIPEPHEMELVRYFDKADNEGGGSENATALVGKCLKTGRIYLIHLWSEHASANQRNIKMVEFCDQDKDRYGAGKVSTYIEQEGGSAGKEINRQLINMLSARGHRVYTDIVSGKQWRTVLSQKIPGQGKINRAINFAAQVENQNVYYLRSIPKINRILDLVTAFPEATISDIVDATSGAINKVLGRSNPVELTPTRINEYYSSDSALMNTFAMLLSKRGV